MHNFDKFSFCVINTYFCDNCNFFFVLFFPIFSQIKQEQSITVNNLLSKLEEKVLAVAASTGDNIRASVNDNLMGGLGWLPVLSSGEMGIPTRFAEFMALFETTKNKIIRRICNSCPDDDYKDIYYRRLTSVNNRKLLNMLRNGHFDLSEYHGVTNVCFQDFTLHSTYEDAKAGTNQWEHCHPLGPVSTSQTYMCTMA